MTVRAPLYMLAPAGEPFKQIYPFATTGVDAINGLAGFAFAINPNPRIEIGGTNGTLLANQPFVDTWWSAGAGTTDVTNYDTAAETPNVFKVTDNYNNVRVVYDSVSLPTGDTNNTQYPLYLYSPAGPVGDDWVDAGFRAMSNQDFIDTFVLPVLDSFGGGGQTLQKSGTYYMTTSAAPANATIIGTAALNQQANPAAYAAASIPETPTQNNTVTTYRIAKVDYPSTASDLWEGAAAPLLYDLPLYFDAGTESIRQHTPATWAALLNPFLRFYLGGGSTAHTISYNIDGADGVTSGTIYTDTGITTAGSTYNTRFVNTNDYRTQEFPTGTATVQSTKAFKIHQGASSAVVEFPSGPYGCTASSSGLSGSCTAQFNVDSAGTVTGSGTIGDVSNTGSLPQTWLISGASSDYEVRFTYTQNINGANVTSAGNGVWLNCGTTRSWSISDSSTNMASNSISGTLEIRDTATSTIQASTTVYLRADQEP